MAGVRKSKTTQRPRVTGRVMRGLVWLASSDTVGATAAEADIAAARRYVFAMKKWRVGRKKVKG